MEEKERLGRLAWGCDREKGWKMSSFGLVVDVPKTMCYRRYAMRKSAQ